MKHGIRTLPGIAALVMLTGGVGGGAAATTAVPPAIHPELARHTAHFDKHVYKVADNVYSAVGWNIANIVMIEGDAGIILVDAGLSPETSREVMREFRKITEKPVVAIIYSHFHHDHIDGVKALTTAEQVRSGEVAIYAHESLMRNLVGESDNLGPILGVRAGYSFGFFLEGADIAGMNAGIGPLPIGGRPGTFIAPTRLVKDELRTTIAGVDLQILHVPSEAPDELAVYLPASRVLIDTEVIQGPTFPNVYTLRGTRFRDPVTWVRSIDRLRALQPEFLVPTHGQPVYGADKAEEVFRMTRDGIQYVHDQTVRYMNKGLTPDELVEVVKLPPHLADYAPYLRQYYGTVKQAVREIYAGYLGWFAGDPVDLDPVPPVDKATRLVDMMGGRDTVLHAAETAYETAEYQWASELLSYLVRIDHQDLPARQLKAAAFRQLGYASMNINWRNWYLSAALELEGRLDAGGYADKMAKIFMPPDIVTEIPARVSIRGWTTRLKAEQTLGVEMSLGFEFTDLKEGYALTIRRGVCEFAAELPEQPDLLLTLTKPAYDRIVLGTVTLQDAIGGGEIRLRGDRRKLTRFIDYFEPPGASPVSLTLH